MLPSAVMRSAVAALALAVSGTGAAAVPRAEPAEVGFNAAKLARIETLTAEKARKGELAGIVILVARHGKVAHLSATGAADVPKQKPMQPDSVFRIYSMTKAITATALMSLYEEGRFQLGQPISDFIPEFAGLKVLRSPDAAVTDTVAPQHEPTIQDSLRHTDGFSHGLGTDAYEALFAKAGYFGLDVTLEGMMSRLAKIPLRHQPGKHWEYSIGPDINARLVEILSGQRFDEYLRKRIFEPLGMKDTAFSLPREKAGRLATVHWMKDGKLTPLDAAHGSPKDGGIITDPSLVNSYTVDHPRKGGSYGLVSTAEDYWRFTQMILNGGELDGVRILGPRTVQYMLSDHLSGDGVTLEGGETFGLGFGLVKDVGAKSIISSKGSAYWGGSAATQFWIDPSEDLIIIAMTQHFEVPGAWSVGEQIQSIVYGAIEK
jgi:CubicO group peptidase (beta-lactamase class C family)